MTEDNSDDDWTNYSSAQYGTGENIFEVEEINESNLLIDSNVSESLKEIEILASNGILQESLPLIIDAYYYNQNNSNSLQNLPNIDNYHHLDLLLDYSFQQVY